MEEFTHRERTPKTSKRVAQLFSNKKKQSVYFSRLPPGKVFAFETDKGLVGRGKLGRPTSLLLLSFVEVKVVFVFLCVFET